MSTLFNDENSDSDGELKINTGYANNYDNWRQKEELNKLKTKYGDTSINDGASEEESDDDSSSEEDEDGKVFTEQFDKEFYKTLACLKNKDPRIYDESVTFFNNSNELQALPESQEQSKTTPAVKSKKKEIVSLRDYERKIILERGGKYSDSEDEDLVNSKDKKIGSLTYVEEQKKLKESFKNALNDNEEAEDDDLLKPKTVSEQEKQKEEEVYKEWLKGQRTNIDVEEQEELRPLREFWTNPNLDVDEKFLRDYVLNNKYLENGNPITDLDYEQVAHDSDENLSEDERNIQKQEEFEHKYNFRFEEPDKEFIKRYPRTMENSMRKKDTRRAEKRAEIKKRKEDEKLRKMEELKQLKALKRKEIEEKIEKLKEITGNDDIRFNDVDLEGDFDPGEYDKKMSEIFNEKYYAVSDEVVKPEFPDIDEELGIESPWDNYDPNTEEISTSDHESQQQPHCEDLDFIMDADYDGSQHKQSGDSVSEKKKKRRRRTKFAELIAQEKPKFDPEQYRSYPEYFDKYYSLDYEDMIGDMPCRFKYRKVVPNDYGLSVEEILAADDKELNKWCSLKKALQYKPEHVELNDVRMYQQKAQNDALKRKILRSLYEAPKEDDDQGSAQELKEEAGVSNPSANESADKTVKKKRRRNKKKNSMTKDLSKEITNNIEGKTVSVKITEKKSVNAEPVKASKENGNASDVATESTEPKSKKKKRKAENSIAYKEGKKMKPSPVENNNTIEHSTKQLRNSSKSKKQNVARQSAIASKDRNTKEKQKSAKKSLVRKSNNNTDKEIISMNPERLRMYGINPKKLKNKLKYGNKER